MRSAGLFAVLIGLILVTGSGCRELSTENTDRNRAPETYLSAAPVDSIAGGGLTRVAHRYRASWSGADVDGEVVGFFVAVTETTVEASTGRPFRLPAPLPSQYRFTTSRESLFVFSILEGRGSDRQHALYVYAVDNQGRVDATPAVTHFVARDQNLPTVQFLRAEGSGTVFEFDGLGILRPSQYLTNLNDSTEVPAHAPQDTIPTGGEAYFEWIGQDIDFASSITGYLYKLTETELVRADSTVTSIRYGTDFGPAPGPIPVGPNTMRVRAIDEAGGTTQPDEVRQLFVNFSPDTWFAGPDVAALGGFLESDSLGTYFPNDPNIDWPIDFPGNPFGADTLITLPAERKAMDGLDPKFDPKSNVDREFRPKTFLEGRFRLDRQLRWYVRQEGDTIAFASRLVARLGGFDRDSPYAVRGGSPDHESPVLRSGPQNGSPVAFVARLYRIGRGGAVEPGFSTPFPNFDQLDAFRNESVLFQVEKVETGIGYLQAKAVDGNRTSDDRIGNPFLADTLATTPPALRSKFLKFYINFRPGLLTISPVAGEVVNPPGDRITAVIRMTDPDPDPTYPRPGSSPYNSMFFAVRARIHPAGQTPLPNEGWQDPVINYYFPDANPAFFPYTLPVSLDLAVPSDLPDGPAILEYEIEDNPDINQSRTIRVQVPFHWRVGP